MNIGDIHYVNFDGKGSQQRGKRPAIIVQSIKGIRHSPIIKVIPLTASKEKIARYFDKPEPYHVFLDVDAYRNYGLTKDSLVLCEQPTKVTREDILEKISIKSLPFDVMRKITIASAYDSPLLMYLDTKSFNDLASKLRRENNVCVSCA
jgi:mRNA interferase MazF